MPMCCDRLGVVLAMGTDGITKRDRAAYRVATPVRTTAPALPDHLVPLTRDWALWRWMCLRGAGFPFAGLTALASPGLAEAADALIDASGTDDADAAARHYRAQFTRAARQLSEPLHAAASDPRFREAVAWQNRTALESGIGALLRRDPATAVRNRRHRANEALVASYVQRYCGKNETIGFFGPS